MSSATSYKIKTISFFGRQVPVLCQNENGPCPLLAICNILLLQKNITIHPDFAEISFSELTQLVAGYLLDSNPPNEDFRINANQQTQLDAVIKLLPRLQYGLDVNVRFDDIRGFEFTEEMAAFDMTGTTLLHGWIVDPEDKDTARVIRGMSYNKLVEKLLDYRSRPTEKRREQDEQVSDAASSSEDSTRQAQDGGPSNDNFCEGKLASQLSQDDERFRSARSTGDSWGNTGKENLYGDGVERGERANVAREEKSSVDACDQRQDSVESSGAHSNSCTPDTTHGDSEWAVAQASREDTGAAREGLIVEAFYSDTASQLTYYGLSRLHEEVRERQLSVFFRNNHFSTLFKYEGKLYILITDLGYARESSVVWEKLDQIDGDSEYVDSDFARSSRCNPAHASVMAKLATDENEDRDYMLALAIQQEDASAHYAAPVPSAKLDGGYPMHAMPNQGASVADGSVAAGTTWSDGAIALALHREEQAQLTAQDRQRSAMTGLATDPALSRHDDPRNGRWRASQDGDRRRQAKPVRTGRSETGSGCSIQ